MIKIFQKRKYRDIFHRNEKSSILNLDNEFIKTEIRSSINHIFDSFLSIAIYTISQLSCLITFHNTLDFLI